MKYIIVKVKSNGQSLKKQARDVFEEIVTLYPKPSDLLAAKQDKFQLTECELTDLSVDPIPYEKGYTIFAIQIGPDSTPNLFDLINGASKPVDKDFYSNARILLPNQHRNRFDLTFKPDSDQIIVKPAPVEQPIELTPFQAAIIAIAKLRAELRDEMGRCGFIRFFTDFNNTKAAKYAALGQLFDGFNDKTITDMAGLADEAKKFIKDPNVIYTSSVLTSRTATLLNNIIAAGDKTSTVKNTI